MGNCECNTCPGEGIVPLQQSKKGFTEEIQVLIQVMRDKYKDHFKQMKELRLPNGKIYRGVLARNKKQGYGEYYSNNNAYFGLFKNDLPEGEGLLVQNYKDFIKGTFANGKPNGEVRQKIEGVEFQGHYSDGQKSKGVLTSNAYTYEGGFKDNMFHGYGILSFNNGDRYEGDFQRGAYHGDGSYETVEQGKYHGKFKDGVYDGKGTFKWRDNYYYEGQYCKGVRHGQGKFVKGITEHQGIWIDGQPEANSRMLSLGEQKMKSSMSMHMNKTTG